MEVTKNKSNASKNEYVIPPEILDDLSSRFIINVPKGEKRDLIRVLFQIELAHWFYIDFYCKNPDSQKTKSCNMREFSLAIFKHIPFLMPYVKDLDRIIEEWKDYKFSVPTYGGILLDEDLTHVLLVQSYWSKSSWGFPKGKVNKDESPWHCAIREVYEETGFNISHLIDQNKYIEAYIHDQLVRLYIIPGVSKNISFHPRTRFEIKSVKWFHVNDLPVSRKDASLKVKTGISSSAFYMVMPFVKKLRHWITEQAQDPYRTLRRHRYKSCSDIEGVFSSLLENTHKKERCTPERNKQVMLMRPLSSSSHTDKYEGVLQKKLSKSEEHKTRIRIVTRKNKDLKIIAAEADFEKGNRSRKKCISANGKLFLGQLPPHIDIGLKDKNIGGAKGMKENKNQEKPPSFLEMLHVLGPQVNPSDNKLNQESTESLNHQVTSSAPSLTRVCLSEDRNAQPMETSNSCTVKNSHKDGKKESDTSKCTHSTEPSCQSVDDSTQPLSSPFLSEKNMAHLAEYIAKNLYLFNFRFNCEDKKLLLETLKKKLASDRNQMLVASSWVIEVMLLIDHWTDKEGTGTLKTPNCKSELNCPVSKTGTHEDKLSINSGSTLSTEDPETNEINDLIKQFEIKSWKNFKFDIEVFKRM